MKSVVMARHPFDFIDRVLVECPRCGGCGVVETTAETRRMACTHCGAVVEAADGVDRAALGLPLWLRAETRHGVLYAYNAAHLAYIEDYLSGTLREERPDDTGLRNRSIVSRLPRWAKLARNRDDVLKAIERARARL